MFPNLRGTLGNGLAATAGGGMDFLSGFRVPTFKVTATGSADLRIGILKTARSAIQTMEGRRVALARVWGKPIEDIGAPSVPASSRAAAAK